MSRMSPQSIDEHTLHKTVSAVDDYYMEQGKAYILKSEYDIGSDANYEKLNQVIWLNELLERCDKQEFVATLINKKIKQ